MPGNCTVCKHTEVNSIEEALAAKRPLREIAHQFGLSKDAARRHKRHMPGAPESLRAEISPELLTSEIEPCYHHGDVPFWLRDREWVCGDCEPWDGRLAYWKLSGEPWDECDEFRDTWHMEKD
jgi:hypothetical protein